MDWSHFSENIAQWRAIVSAVKRGELQRKGGFLWHLIERQLLCKAEVRHIAGG